MIKFSQMHWTNKLSWLLALFLVSEIRYLFRKAKNESNWEHERKIDPFLANLSVEVDWSNKSEEGDDTEPCSSQSESLSSTPSSAPENKDSSSPKSFKRTFLVFSIGGTLVFSVKQRAAFNNFWSPAWILSICLKGKKIFYWNWKHLRVRTKNISAQLKKGWVWAQFVSELGRVPTISEKPNLTSNQESLRKWCLWWLLWY